MVCNRMLLFTLVQDLYGRLSECKGERPMAGIRKR
jgi:hypothetical protein